MDARPAASAVVFEEVYSIWFQRVVRWLPAMGVARADVEDVAQEVFLIVDRRLASFDGDNLGGWLYAISLRVANNHRRLAWFKRMMFSSDEAPALRDQEASGTPESELSQRQLLALGDEILRGMSEKSRRAFVLFEIEGYSGEEIAALEGIPLATVWTRVHNARKEFATRADKRRPREQP
jgi:RNA polymerase sigma-70 factor (ECF subfamily)